MPIYEYQCGHCQHQYEKKEGFDAPVEQACPVCGGLARRLLHAPGIVFKGSGFYVTDNRKNHEWESAEREAKEEKPPKKEATPKKEEAAAKEPKKKAPAKAKTEAAKSEEKKEGE